VTGATGAQGLTGETGPQGVTGERGKGWPTQFESANLSVPGSSASVQVGNLIYKISYSNTGSAKVELSAASGTVLADVNKTSLYNTTSMDASSFDNTTFTTTPTMIDAIVYNRSNERHSTQIRQQDPQTGLWNLYNVHSFTSAGGARTDVWVEELGTDLSY
jgi:hypothetical protein